MTEATPAATGTLAASTSLTTVNVSARRKVRYVFDTSATKRDLALPYRVSIDGKVQEAEASLCKLSGSKRSIELLVAPGARRLVSQQRCAPRFPARTRVCAASGRA